MRDTSASALVDDRSHFPFARPAACPSRPTRVGGIRRVLWGVLAGGALWIGQGTPAIGAAVKLTDGSAYGGTLGRLCRISPDGTRVVFTADTPAGEVAAVYSVPIAGGSMVQLHGGTVVPENYPMGPMGKPAWVFGKSLFDITADGQSVIYSAEPSVGSVDLYRAPIAGGASVRLASLSGDDVRTLRFYVAPDVGHVVYRVDSGGGKSGAPETVAIHSVLAAGGQPPVTLIDVPLAEGYFAGGEASSPISPDGSRVIFQNGDTLYLMDVGGGPVTTLASVYPKSITGSYFTPDGSRILFTSNSPPLTSHRHRTSYSISVAGGEPVKLLSQYYGPGPTPKGVRSGRVTTVGSTHIITASTSSGVTQFHRVALDTGASTLMGTVTTGTERSLHQRAVLHDASGAVYVGVDDSDASSLWYVPFSDGMPIRLTDDMPPAGSYPPDPVPSIPPTIPCLITPDDRTVVYGAPTVDGRELYSVAITGGASVRLDHHPGAGTYILDYELTPDGEYVVYSVGEPYTGDLGLAYHLKELYAVDVCGGTPWLLSHPLTDEQSIAGDYQIGPDGTVVYWAGNDETGYELHSSAIPEPATLGLLALAGMTLIRRRRCSHAPS